MLAGGVQARVPDVACWWPLAPVVVDGAIGVLSAATDVLISEFLFDHVSRRGILFIVSNLKQCLVQLLLDRTKRIAMILVFGTSGQ